MNMALAEWEASNNYAKPQDVETVMKILAEHGYDAVNWNALSSDYKVMWDSKENRMILVRKSDGAVEYPDDYLEKGVKTTDSGSAERFKIYNQNNIIALATDFSFSSSSNTSTTQTKLGSSTSTSAGQTALSSALTGASANTKLQTALGITSGTSDVYVAASTVSNSATFASGSYASCESLYITEDENLEITADLISTGKYAPNVYVVSVTYGANATQEEKLAAEKAAGEYVYSLFVQINNGKIEESSTIIIPAGTKINCSSHEWQAVKAFSGYFGTPDSANPVIIDGMRLTDATGYAQTFAMNGEASKYFMTGFIGVLNGTSTVENLTFRNVSIKSPAADFTIANNSNNRNTVGIIGGILPDNDNRSKPIDVTLKNIIVEESCSIIGESSVGGLVGYIGAEEDYAYMTGTITIEGCEIGCDVESLDSIYVTSGYAPAGGIIGFTCRCDALTININNSKYTGTVKGFGYVGAVIGDLMNPKVTMSLSNVDASTASLESAGLCTNSKTASYGKDISSLGSIVGRIKGKINYTSTCSFKENLALAGTKADTAVIKQIDG